MIQLLPRRCYGCGVGNCDGDIVRVRVPFRFASLFILAVLADAVQGVSAGFAVVVQGVVFRVQIARQFREILRHQFVQLFRVLVVTGDAMFCQREVCQQVLQQQGHYLFVVKDNQPAPKEAIAAEFAADFSPGEPAATRKAS